MSFLWDLALGSTNFLKFCVTENIKDHSKTKKKINQKNILYSTVIALPTQRLHFIPDIFYLYLYLDFHERTHEVMPTW